MSKATLQDHIDAAREEHTHAFQAHTVKDRDTYELHAMAVQGTLISALQALAEELPSARRDMFAAAALTGLSAHPELGENSADWLARESVNSADALIDVIDAEPTP